MSDPPPPSLPPELWIHIIRLAVPFFIVSDYFPFEEQRIPRHDDVLREKCSFALVCKSWNQIVSPMLAEDIRFVRPQEPYLKTFMSGSAAVEPRGHRTRRLQLTYSHVSGHGEDRLASLFSSCPNIEHLYRPYPSAGCPIHHPSFANIPQLLNLTRVDWACVTRGADAAIVLHSLVDVVNHSPNLRYLSIWGERSSWPVVPLTHPNIQTLRVGNLPNNLDVCVARWEFPSLHYLILESLPAECIRIFSRQVHTVEFAPRLSLRRDGSILMLDLNAKPNLRRINFSVLFFSRPRVLNAEYHHIHEIGVNLCLKEVFGQQDHRSLWTMIKGQLPWLRGREGCGFVHADLIELHGDWGHWEEEAEFIDVKEILKARGAELRYMRD